MSGASRPCRCKVCLCFHTTRLPGNICVKCSKDEHEGDPR